MSEIIGLKEKWRRRKKSMEKALRTAYRSLSPQRQQNADDSGNQCLICIILGDIGREVKILIENLKQVI